MATNNEILAAIPSTEPATFGEFLSALQDSPEKGDRTGWAELFKAIRKLEADGLVEVEWNNSYIDGLMLTGEGVAAVKRERDG